MVINRKEAKSKPPHPPAVSGSDYCQNLQEKQNEKQLQLKKKEQRKEERKKKKSEKKIKNKKTSSEQEGERDEESEEEIINEVLYDNDSDGDIVFEESNHCQGYFGDNDKDDDSAWIGCNSCSKWFHLYCININCQNMTMAQIETLDFNCSSCKRKGAKGKKVL